MNELIHIAISVIKLHRRSVFYLHNTLQHFSFIFQVISSEATGNRKLICICMYIHDGKTFPRLGIIASNLWRQCIHLCVTVWISFIRTTDMIFRDVRIRYYHFKFWLRASRRNADALSRVNIQEPWVYAGVTTSARPRLCTWDFYWVLKGIYTLMESLNKCYFADYKLLNDQSIPWSIHFGRVAMEISNLLYN